MNFPQDRRLLIGAGVAVALIAGIGLAFKLGAGAKDPDHPTQGSLIVEVGHNDTRVDETRQLPCYVNGQSIGMTTHAKCAERNGISSGQLDVGIDQSGELAYGKPGAALSPLPPEDKKSDDIGKLTVPGPAAGPAPVQPAATPVAAPRGPVAACWRYAERDWARLGDMTIEACAQQLFEGKCEKVGGATYGRWGEQTLRLVPGRIEQSPDNRNFRTLVGQGPNCSIPAF